jgi:small subunit ribosomal protein S14
MAKQSSMNKNRHRQDLVVQFAAKRKRLKAIVSDASKPLAERLKVTQKLAEMPRNSSKTRVRNRCELTGRSRGYYRKLKLCRNKLRELSSQGLIPGMVKSSW